MKSILHRWSDEEEKKMWQQGILAFDSSTLLNFYEFSETSRQDIYHNIFPLLKERLWITNQTEYEFLKNREKVINKPKQLYAEVKNDFFPAAPFKSFQQTYALLKQNTLKDNWHPFVSPDTYTAFEVALAAFQQHFAQLEKDFDAETATRIKEHAASIEKDNLLSFFQVTPGFTFSELMALVKEGELRYRQKIPPGYMDELDKDKTGLAKFGRRPL